MNNLPVPINRVIACPSPFSDAQVRFNQAPGKSLLEILQEVQPDLYRYSAHVWVGDNYIPPESWASTYPAPGSDITIRVIPQGSVGRMIGTIFIAIAALAAMVVLQQWEVAPFLIGLVGMLFATVKTIYHLIYS